MLSIALSSGSSLSFHYEQQAFHELTGCPHEMLACGFFHLRLRVAPVKEGGCGSPGTIPGVRWPNLAAPIRLLLSSIIQPQVRRSCGVNREAQARRCGYDPQSSAANLITKPMGTQPIPISVYAQGRGGASQGGPISVDSRQVGIFRAGQLTGWYPADPGSPPTAPPGKPIWTVWRR